MTPRPSLRPPFHSADALRFITLSERINNVHNRLTSTRSQVKPAETMRDQPATARITWSTSCARPINSLDTSNGHAGTSFGSETDRSIVSGISKFPYLKFPGKQRQQCQ